MPRFDDTFFGPAIPAVPFTGLSRGGFGSGAAFAATPILAPGPEPGAAPSALFSAMRQIGGCAIVRNCDVLRNKIAE